MYPTLFHFGHLYVPSFGVLAAVGILVALLLSERTAPLAGIEKNKLWDTGIFSVFAAFLLSRLLLVATNIHTFLAYPVVLLAMPSLTATGLLLAAIATAGWLYVKRISLLGALDAWSPCASLLWVFLALGHFAEGSDPGMPTSLPWHVHPVALYAAIAASLVTPLGWILLRRHSAPSMTAAFTLALAGLAQFLLSFLRVPGELSFGGLDLLQIVSLGMLLAGIALGARTLVFAQRQ